MANEAPKPSLEELKRERRRKRWEAFLTPIITLTSIVASIGLLMFFLKSCQERLPHKFILKQDTAPKPKNDAKPII